MSASIASFDGWSEPLHAAFRSILPRLETHARVYFRGEKCPDQRADRVAEVVALAWKWFRRLAERGRDGTQFPCALASLAARAVKCGRRVHGQHKAGDVMNESTQRRHAFRVESLPSSLASPHDRYAQVRGQRLQDVYEERLCDNTATPPDEQAAFRIDFPAWLATWSERDRRILADMARNERTQILAHKYGLSPARISQLRGQYRDDWRCFIGADGLVWRRRVGRKRVRA